MNRQQNMVRMIVTTGPVTALLAFALLAWAGGGNDLPGNGGPSISPPETPVAPTPPPAAPTTGMYARFDEVEGESLDADHKGWIDLESWSWGASQTGISTGQTRRRGVVTVEDIMITKKIDKASPKLAEAVCTGQFFKEVEIHSCASYGAGGSRTFLVHILKNVMVSSYKVAGSAWSDAVPTEAISLNFEEIEETYTQYDTAGEWKGEEVYAWDVAENATQ